MKLTVPSLLSCALAALLIGSTAASAATPAFEVQETVSAGTVYTVVSPVMGMTRKVAVYVPRECSQEERCPTLYLIDGGAEQDLLPTVGLSKLGALSSMYPAMIVVGIETQDRRNELTFPTDDAEHRTAFPTLGGSERFRRFIVDEVKPWVQASFPASEHDLVMGESLAGLFVLETALREPEAFDDYISVSPSMWWDNMGLADEARALVPRITGQHALYLTYADEGGKHAKGTDKIVAVLKSSAPKGLRWTFRPRVNEAHSTIYHGAALDAVRWVFEN